MAAPHSVTAQRSTPQAGDYVRVWPYGHPSYQGELRGELVRVDQDGLAVRLDRWRGPQREWTWAEIERLEVRTGTQRTVRRCALTGLAGGQPSFQMSTLQRPVDGRR